ncbi:MAG: hypothetical protein IPM53_01880 [Anaerolineaceae bacterium]|nr:hypothetical protein [Anaerolineaceae bacterium]
MNSKKNPQFRIKINFTNQGQAPSLQAYVFSKDGQLLGSAPVEKDTAVIRLPDTLNGRNVNVILGPQVEKEQPAPTAAALKRMGAYVKPTRYLVERPELELNIPIDIFPSWCFCFVHGRLVKRVTLPDGTIVELPVCHARVHICEVDYIPLVIAKLPDPLILRLRDDLLDRLKVIPWPPVPPVPPIPDPGPRRMAVQSEMASLAPTASMAAGQYQSVVALAGVTAVSQIRYQLSNLADIIKIYLCDWLYLWPYFKKDCLTTVEVDSEGRFYAFIAYDCDDKPDLYFWVEQFQDGAWHTVYKPSIGCGTYWNYDCGTEIVINVPGAVACYDPPYDVPPGVTLFVLPYAIGHTPIWGIPPGAPPAPNGWLRPDGYVNYHSGSSLGWLYDAPFGEVLNFIHDDSYFIPSDGVKYYRYSYRRANPANPNTGANDASWTPITTPLSRGYRMEYSDRLPTYEAYPVGPVTVGSQSGLFEFKPQTPPARPSDPPTVLVREWVHGNLGETAASWDTRAAAPALSATNTTDDAGDFEVKIEVFDASGNQVMPGAATFRFLARNFDGTTTRLATAPEIAGGAYVLLVHVDNNHVSADLPQPSIGGVAASDDCGFLRYEPGDLVHIRFLATHPNDRAVFRFVIKRGSNTLSLASTQAPYVETAAASAPTDTAPYNKVGDYYQRNFTPGELVGSCVDAAFAASLAVYGKATNGWERLGLDASRLIAFALAEEELEE